MQPSFSPHPLNTLLLSLLVCGPGAMISSIQAGVSIGTVQLSVLTTVLPFLKLIVTLRLAETQSSLSFST